MLDVLKERWNLELVEGIEGCFQELFLSLKPQTQVTNLVRPDSPDHIVPPRSLLVSKPSLTIEEDIRSETEPVRAKDIVEVRAEIGDGVVDIDWPVEHKVRHGDDAPRGEVKIEEKRVHRAVGPRQRSVDLKRNRKLKLKNEKAIKTELQRFKSNSA